MVGLGTTPKPARRIPEIDLFERVVIDMGRETGAAKRAL
jgi:hypothetical protein